MSLYDLPGWAQHFDKQIRPKMKFLQVAGAAANTNIAVAGIKAADAILVCYNVTSAAHVTPPVVTSAGNVQFPGITTGSNFVLGYFVV